MGQLLVNDALPPQYQDHSRQLIGGELDDLLGRIGRENPELYRGISHKLMELGRHTAYEQGTTIRLSDLQASSKMRDEVFAHVDKQEEVIENSKLSPAEKRQAIAGVYAQAQELITNETYAQAKASNNPLALQVLSKSRGNPTQLSAMLSTPGAFQDTKGNTIPIFVRRSYAEGLTPAEYYASTFGARRGVVSTKFATRDAGDFGKQLNVAAADLIVVEDDCGTTNGIPVGPDDNDTVGAVLARGSGGFKLGVPVDAKMLKSFQKNNVDKILIRSPITCQSQGGVCKQCVGLRENGKFPELRSAVGIQASSALAERIAQGSLNVKHSGGQSSKGEATYAGFDVINQLGQIPSSFRYKAILAESDGLVTKIEPAPQGGTNVFVGEELHYVEPEQAVTVKVGDDLEAGDQMATGIINPAEVVRHKGIGEGRRYFAERLTQAFKDSKLQANRRNTELIARAVIDHVDIEEPSGLGDFLPGDVASYNSVAYGYKPRVDAGSFRPTKAVGQYLEQPAMHYTIGTRVTKKIAKELEGFGVNAVTAHTQQPGFTPRMIRLRAVPHYGNDWMAKLHGSYLQTNLLKDVQEGSQSNIHGTHPVPGIAYGAEFGESKKNKVTF